MKNLERVIDEILNAEKSLRRILDQQLSFGRNDTHELRFRIRHLSLARESYETGDVNNGLSHLRNALDGPNP